MTDTSTHEPDQTPDYPTALRDQMYEAIVDLLSEWKTEPYGDVRLNPNRIAGKVMTHVVGPELDRLMLTTPTADPDTTTGADHETPTIDAYRVGWTTYAMRVHLPWKAAIVLGRCTCQPVQALTCDRARVRMLRAHSAAVAAGRCPA